jgi:hypothetical protein
MVIDKQRLITQMEHKAYEQECRATWSVQSNDIYEKKKNAEVIRQAIEKIKKEW